MAGIPQIVLPILERTLVPALLWGGRNRLVAAQIVQGLRNLCILTKLISITFLLVTITLAAPCFVVAADKPNSSKVLSDQAITQRIIDRSIASYSGNCPCPYSRASNGSRCGKRSAYSNPGGAAPICYPAQVSKEMIEAHRSRLP